MLVDNDCFDKRNLKNYIKELKESFVIDNAFVKLSELHHKNDTDSFYLEVLQMIQNRSKNWKEKQESNKNLSKEIKRQRLSNFPKKFGN